MHLTADCARLTRYENAILVAIGIALAVLLRYSLLDFESRDFTVHFSGWYDTIRQQGFRALKTDFANYPPLYLYGLTLISAVLPKTPAVVAVKLLSVASDFILAWFGARIVGLKYGRSHPASLLAFFAIVFAPTVVLNSSFWGQNDSMYTAAIVACVYFLLREREPAAWLAFALAFSVKFQAVFLAPVLLVLLIKRLLAWKWVLLVPAVYVLTVIPAWLIGRPLGELLTIYVSQVGQYPALVVNAPNLYTWLPQELFALLYPAGLIYGAILCFLFIVAVYKSRVQVTPSLLLQMVLVSLLILPYFLPKMHDRYFYPADVFSIVYAFYLPALFWVPLAVNLASFFTYVPYLFTREIIPLPILALVLLIVIAVTARRLILDLYPGGQSEETGPARPSEG
jgi:Gpi18-like mannosyltransferase